MEWEEIEKLLISATLEESDSDVMLSDQEPTEEYDHVSECSQSTDTYRELSDSDDIPFFTVRSRIWTDVNQTLSHEEYASSSTEMVKLFAEWSNQIRKYN